MRLPLDDAEGYNGFWKDQYVVDVNGNYAFDGDVRIGAFDVDGSIYSASFGLTWSFR